MTRNALVEALAESPKPEQIYPLGNMALNTGAEAAPVTYQKASNNMAVFLYCSFAASTMLREVEGSLNSPTRSTTEARPQGETEPTDTVVTNRSKAKAIINTTFFSSPPGENQVQIVTRTVSETPTGPDPEDSKATAQLTAILEPLAEYGVELARMIIEVALTQGSNQDAIRTLHEIGTLLGSGRILHLHPQLAPEASLVGNILVIAAGSLAARTPISSRPQP